MNKKSNEVTYGFLAEEYYDETLHPTCSNLREASKELIREIIRSGGLGQFKNVLEIGAGKSLLIELIEEEGFSFEKILITDSNEAMLQHTKNIIRDINCEIKVLDAEKTGFVDQSFDLIISSLGDPYNTLKLWFEISRILSKNGLCIFTTPSFDWSQKYRGNSLNHKFAEFLTKDNELVKVPSFIYDYNGQNEILSKAGLEIVKTYDYKLNELQQKIISSKLKISDNKELTIVTVYLVRKK